ncbi:MAG: hypothetical protein RLZZ520_1322 [Bacteroidota bacterium]|jgi:hypothetical protein
MQKLICILICLLFIKMGIASQLDSIPVSLNYTNVKPGDTLEFNWNGNAIGKGYAAASLHLWIDHIESGKRWKLRYPILNGSSEGALIISDSLPQGNYAFNFMAADQFIEINGKVQNVKIKTAYNYKSKKKDTIAVFELPKMKGKEMRYTLLGQAKILHNDYVNVDDQGGFKIPAIVFGDSAQLLFDPGRGRGVYWINLETPLDSAFTPFHSTTLFVGVQKKGTVQELKKDTAAYVFEFEDPYPDAVVLDEIVLKGKSNAEKFEDDFVSKLFKASPDARTIDALDNNELMRSNSILTFLQSRVGGLFIRSDGITTNVTWRGAPVDFFINEFPVDVNNLNLSPMDVALIKVHPPPSQLRSLSNGGAIAIYTKRGVYESQKGVPQYNFMVKGYTQGISRLKTPE